jgi:hypothetical protein
MLFLHGCSVLSPRSATLTAAGRGVCRSRRHQLASPLRRALSFRASGLLSEAVARDQLLHRAVAPSAKSTSTTPRLRPASAAPWRRAASCCNRGFTTRAGVCSALRTTSALGRSSAYGAACRKARWPSRRSALRSSKAAKAPPIDSPTRHGPIRACPPSRQRRACLHRPEFVLVETSIRSRD